MTTAATSPASGPPYRVGTLSYTKAGLVTLFAWMLWGDFCFTLMEMILPRLLPLQLKGFGASSLAMGLLVGTIPGAMNFVITPIVSFRSDRTRSRWGRRIPFLLWPTPFICLFLVLLGYSDSLGKMIEAWNVSGALGIKPLTLTLVLIGVLMVGFQFFNMFVASVYYYLFNDVVPEQFLGRFMALFRVVGTLASFVFLRYVFGWAETHMKEVYLGAAVLYCLSFVTMCLRVKEGEYPPPPSSSEGPGLWGGVKTYFRECYTHPYYLWFFAGTALWSVSGAGGMFAVFFAKDIGMTVDTFGKVMAWCSLISAVILYPMGSLVDRFHPLRMVLFASVLLIPFNALAFFCVHGPTSFLVVALAAVPLGAVYGAASLPMFMELLPRERYGQFCSAQAMLSAAAMMGGTALVGLFMDMMGNNYRYLYVWAFVLQVLSVLCMVAVYRGWRNHGGLTHYVPPKTNSVAVDPS